MSVLVYPSPWSPPHRAYPASVLANGRFAANRASVRVLTHQVLLCETAQMGDADSAEWARRRRETAQVQADRLTRTREVESERARELLRGFVAEARRRGMTPGPLLARAGDGPPTYRTGLEGWYLTRDGAVAVDVDGQYYLLGSPRSLRSRMLGVTVPPSDPPLQVGAGGRDGESIALDALLTLRLDAGSDWRVHGS